MLGRTGALGFAFVLIAAPATALAQDAAPSPEQTAEAGTGGEGETEAVGAASVEDEQKLAELEHDRADEPRAPSDPYEDPNETYYFIGLFYEHTFTPAGFIQLFTDKSPSANNPGAGLEFISRKDGMSIMARLYWQGGYADGAFRGPGDAEHETEIVHSDLWAIMASATFLWSTAFNDIVAFEYGIGVGVGGVGGDLERTEAWRNSPDDRWEECDGPGDPRATNGRHCEGGGHYDHKPDNWFGGGSIPALWFRLDLPHLALRIKPVKQFQVRLDFGFQVPMGPFLGLTASYGI